MRDGDLYLINDLANAGVTRLPFNESPPRRQVSAAKKTTIEAVINKTLFRAAVGRFAYDVPDGVSPYLMQVAEAIAAAQGFCVIYKNDKGNIEAVPAVPQWQKDTAAAKELYKYPATIQMIDVDGLPIKRVLITPCTPEDEYADTCAVLFENAPLRCTRSFIEKVQYVDPIQTINALSPAIADCITRMHAVLPMLGRRKGVIAADQRQHSTINRELTEQFRVDGNTYVLAEQWQPDDTAFSTSSSEINDIDSALMAFRREAYLALGISALPTNQNSKERLITSEGDDAQKITECITELERSARRACLNVINKVFGLGIKLRERKEKDQEREKEGEGEK